MTYWFLTAILFIPVAGSFEPAQAQSLIREDNRAYSDLAVDRAYIAARCAALYSEMAQMVRGTNDPLADTKASEARKFLMRVSPLSENVFLKWSSAYKAQLARQQDPGSTPTGKDYEACARVLNLIRDGDKMRDYSREKLRYLMGG